MKPVRNRKLVVMVSVLAAMVMLFVFAGVSQASGGGNGDEVTVCVDGYVINHREVPVDGTKTEPPLQVTAVGGHTNNNDAAAEAQAANGESYTVDVDEHGYFEFEELPEGTWDFILPLPYEWDSIVPPAPRSSDVAPSEARTGATMLEEKKHGGCYRIVFKIRRLIDVPVMKWEELNDGTVQPGEGWDITFEPQDDPFVKKQTETTAEDGMAYFTVTPGDWKIYEKVKKGWMPITPWEVYLELDQYGPIGARDWVVFKNWEPVCYGTIVVEKTGLGTDEAGGMVWLGPLAGWEITLSRADGAIKPITKTTDASGRVTFDDLKPGVYSVEEKVQNGWKAVSKNPQTIVIRDCETQRVLFENEEITGELSIHGVKLFKAWEKPYKGTHVGLSGWVMTATLKGTDYSVTTTTNALGEFWFTQEDLEAANIAVPGATITVCEEERDNWIALTPDCVDVMFPYPVPPNYMGEYVEFVNYQDPPMTGMSSGGAMASAGSCSARYAIQKGDTLSGIAAKHGASISALAQANSISDPNKIRYGTMLCIP